MIFKIRRQIALYFGTFLMLLSLGLLKPNTSGIPTIADSSNPAGNSAIGLDVDDFTQESDKPLLKDE